MTTPTNPKHRSALQLHIFAVGPLWESLLWPSGGLMFDPFAALVVAGVMGVGMALLAAAWRAAARLRGAT